jgi:phytoene synthase
VASDVRWSGITFDRSGERALPSLVRMSRLNARSDARCCERITRLHARTFALASHLLPAHKRRAAFALYAFCRVADDMVDLAIESGNAPAAGQLEDYARSLREALSGRPESPVFRELARAVCEYDVPASVLDELLAGIARDLRPVRYRDWSELAAYCAGVASSVGEMCTYVFGVQGDAAMRTSAVHYARTLGIAMQLTNILRDVGEDARRGRCYLPVEDLAAFGITVHEVLHDTGLAGEERWRAFMAFSIRRARALYAAAEPGIALLAPDAQRCATACASGYAAILDAIEANGHDSISQRARLPHWRRATILWGAWRHRPAAALPGGLTRASDTTGELARWA